MMMAFDADASLTLVSVSHDHIIDVCRRCPVLAGTLWHDTLVDAAIFREWTINVGHRRARSRVVHLLLEVSTRLQAAGVTLAVCGEMGGRPLEAMALLALGIERLSITPAAIGPVKAMVRSLDRAAAGAEMTRLLAEPPRDLRGHLARWAETNGVALASRAVDSRLR